MKELTAKTEREKDATLIEHAPVSGAKRRAMLLRETIESWAAAGLFDNAPNALRHLGFAPLR